MFHEDRNTGGIVLSPKAGFILGLVGGALILCTIGFFILLSMTLKGGMPAGKLGGSPSGVAPAAGAPSAGAPDAGEQVGDVPAVTGDDHVRGDKGAKVTLVEYSDFQCPFCGRFHPTMVQLMSDPDLKGKIRWVFRHYPLSFHPNATPAANASECAAEQGKFWEFADEMFSNQDGLSDSFYGSTADKIGLNRSKFDSCYSAKKYQARITADQTGGSAAGVTGTPGTIILGKDGSKTLIPGAVPFDQAKAMIQAAL